ncbi:unnamed protein product [Haemonchus placei]|uniref:Uncharacterized protein n=1 Tax=Haemonchus placei TaxID=6290 RepID=A0A3P7X3T1_HAEPC|nr:unnamed protein product [Haemonchus placei]
MSPQDTSPTGIQFLHYTKAVYTKFHLHRFRSLPAAFYICFLLPESHQSAVSRLQLQQHRSLTQFFRSHRIHLGCSTDDALLHVSSSTLPPFPPYCQSLAIQQLIAGPQHRIICLHVIHQVF